jgi:hypothetical protein
MSTLLILTIATVAIVLFFDYTNGFHDAANIVATIIASRAMTPVQAVIIVGTFEFLGPLLGGTAVANTIGKFVTLERCGRPLLSLAILISGLVGAIVWNLGNLVFGYPFFLLARAGRRTDRSCCRSRPGRRQRRLGLFGNVDERPDDRHHEGSGGA